MLRTFRHLVLDLIIVVTVIGTGFFLYQTYGDRVMNYLLGNQKVAMFVRDISVAVTIADSPEERSAGLGGVKELPANEGKLFIFGREGNYGFWMKNTLIPLDIIWINDNRKIVHIEENVKPDSYPTSYGSPVPARFVLEVNAFFVSTHKINLGDAVTIPAGYLPSDLQP